MPWLSHAGPRVRRLVGAAQLAALAVLVYLGMAGARSAPAVLALLAIVGLSWVAWAVVGQLPEPARGATALTLALTGVLGAAGGLLAGLGRVGSAEAFPSVAVFAAGSRLSFRWSLPVFAVTEAAVAVGSAAGRPLAGGVVQDLLIPTIVFLAGINRRQFVRRKEKEVEMAALAERARIAREIHDVLAHALAGLSVQLEAARLLLAEHGDPGSALAHVERAQRQAAEGMAETRQAVAALRDDARPLPELLARLVEQHRATASTVATLSVRGTPRTLPPQAALAVYRATQEALTNAARHAPGSAVKAELRYGEGETLLTITDAGSADGAPGSGGGAPGSGGGAPGSAGGAPGSANRAAGGYGLVGMAERAELAGGSLRAGAFDSGWRVELRVPA